MTATLSDYSSRPCPAWCTDCTGWEGDDAIDGRTHRHYFSWGGFDHFLEVYAIERRDGSMVEVAAELLEGIEYLNADEIRSAAMMMSEVARWMDANGIIVQTSDPVRLAQIAGMAS